MENTKQLVNETIETLKEYIPKLQNACNDITEALQTNSHSTALQLIGQFSEGMDWVSEANILLAKLNVEVNIEELTNINGFFKEINSALSIEDYVLVADLFQYEVKPSLDKVNEAL
ncbi:hypothetical protein V8V54_19745 [Priestia megaterium]|uniref:hypothetical protein n=1 Tax=Priestia megaterium TaxID=1404 RepID=UPI00300B945C